MLLWMRGKGSDTFEPREVEIDEVPRRHGFPISFNRQLEVCLPITLLDQGESCHRRWNDVEAED